MNRADDPRPCRMEELEHSGETDAETLVHPSGRVRAVAACCAFLFLFSANYLTTLVTGSRLLSKVGIKVYHGTQFCHSAIAK